MRACACGVRATQGLRQATVKASSEASSKAGSTEYLGFVLALAVLARREASDQLASFATLLLALLVSTSFAHLGLCLCLRCSRDVRPPTSLLALLLYY